MTVTPSFLDLSIASFAGASILLDIDGTLVCDGVDELDAATVQKLSELGTRATVYLFSNSGTLQRSERFATATGTHALVSTHRKPDPRLVRELPHKHLVVIGDMYLMDGLLAKRVGARFIKTHRLTNSRERIARKVAYVLDALIGRAVCFLVPKGV